MLKLDSTSQDPFWLDLLPGVRLQVRPVTVAAMLLARAAAAEALRAKGDEDDVTNTVNAGAAFTRSLARTGILGWEGIGDAAGLPVEPAPERIDQLLEHWPAFDAIDRLYVGPAIMQDAEKNG